MRGRDGEKLRFKCLNSDRDGKIAKKTGIQTKGEKEILRDELFCVEKEAQNAICLLQQHCRFAVIYVCAY